MNIDKYDSIIGKFEEVVNFYPKKKAIICNNEDIVFVDLMGKVNKYFDNFKSCSGQNIGIYMRPSINRIACIMAIMKAGAVYVPLERRLPINRITEIVENAKIGVIITDDKEVKNIGKAKCFYYDTTIYNNQLEENRNNRNSQLAYIIYTSGSTGAPKGVMISKKALVNFMLALQKRLDFKEDEIVLSHTSCSFDISIFEMIISLCYGFTIVVADDKCINNIRKLKALIIEKDVTVLQVTPSLLINLMYDKNLTFLKKVKLLMVGGERFPEHILPELFQFQNMKIYNMYGPTEATIWASASLLTPGKEVTIGKSFDNYEFHIRNVDELGQGELCISGVSVGEGYFNREEETNRYFIKSDQLKLYATGDIVKKGPDGCPTFVGRKDSQIKLRGYRVELEEIENQIKRLGEIDEVIVVHIKKDELNYLVAVIKSNDRDIIQKIDLCSNLPKYMVPDKFFFVKEMFYTINGKVDRKTMELLIRNRELEGVAIHMSLTEIYETILRIIKKYIPSNIIEDVLNKTLEELSINSLSFVKIIVDIETIYDIEFEDEVLSLDSFNNIQSIIVYVLSRLEENEKNIWV